MSDPAIEADGLSKRVDTLSILEWHAQRIVERALNIKRVCRTVREPVYKNYSNSLGYTLEEFRNARLV